MKKSTCLILLFCFLAMTFASTTFATVWTKFKEDPNDPIYNPFPDPTTMGETPSRPGGTQVRLPPSPGDLAEDYFPCVLFNKQRFNGHGDLFLYKMWHQGPNGIALSYSNDGVNWMVKSSSVIPGVGGNAFHPCVIFDKHGFGGGPYFYKAWYWTGTASATDVGVIQFVQSKDGINWTSPQSVNQDPNAPLAVGNSGDYFYHLYGPGFVMYNPKSTSIPGVPYTFPYIMFFDTATESPTPTIPTIEQIGLAYSKDGINWIRFGNVPVVIPSGDVTAWDGNYAFRPSIVIIKNIYHMYYSGSNSFIDPTTTITYAHGIGHAWSRDGINWIKDPSNPVFIYSDGVVWRNSRTYTPSVIFNPKGLLQMWFTGGMGLTAGEEQGIGYAILRDSMWLKEGGF